MLLNYLKEWVVKRKVKNNLIDERTPDSSDVIKTVGLLIDGQYMSDINKLIEPITSSGIPREDIHIVVYKKGGKSEKSGDYLVCTANDLGWNAEINNKAIIAFTAKKFDLLINYYDVEKALLLLITDQSQAQFKAGFSSMNKKLNNLMINVNAENHQMFIPELFRYLKILNKI